MWLRFFLLISFAVGLQRPALTKLEQKTLQRSKSRSRSLAQDDAYSRLISLSEFDPPLAALDIYAAVYVHNFLAAALGGGAAYPYGEYGVVDEGEFAARREVAAASKTAFLVEQAGNTRGLSGIASWTASACPDPSCQVIIYLMWTIPYTFQFYNSYMAVGITNRTMSAKEAYEEMYYGKEADGSWYQRVDNGRKTISVRFDDLFIEGTMTSGKQHKASITMRVFSLAPGAAALGSSSSQTQLDKYSPGTDSNFFSWLPNSYVIGIVVIIFIGFFLYFCCCLDPFGMWRRSSKYQVRDDRRGSIEEVREQEEDTLLSNNNKANINVVKQDPENGSLESLKSGKSSVPGSEEHLHSDLQCTKLASENEQAPVHGRGAILPICLSYPEFLKIKPGSPDNSFKTAKSSNPSEGSFRTVNSFSDFDKARNNNWVPMAKLSGGRDSAGNSVSSSPDSERHKLREEVFQSNESFLVGDTVHTFV